VPHVASEPKTHPLKPLQPHTARSAPDRVPTTPFGSLLDDGAPGAAGRALPSDDNAARSERPDRAAAPARAKTSKAEKTGDNDRPDKPKSADPKSGEAKSDDAKSADTKPTDTKSADAKSDEPQANMTDKPAGDSTATEDGKEAAETKTTDLAAGIDVSITLADGKPAGGPIPAVVAAAPAADPIATITPADAVATVLAPAPGAAAQTAPAAENAALVVAATAKPAALTSPHADAGKAADKSKPAAKTELLPHAGGKPQAATVDADTDANAQARGEGPAKDNRAASAHAPGALAIENNAAAPKAGADTAQLIVLTAPSHNTAPTPASLAATPQLAPQAVPVPLAGVALEITNKARAGTNHFEIRLDPPELGRIEVRLDVDRDGNVTSRMIADRIDTLDLLRRDASGLERALQDAGLKTTGNSLQFSLRDHSTGREQTHGGADTARLAAEDETLAAIEPAPIDYSRLTGHSGGLDIRV